jgi:hypothetical protein
VVVVGRDTGDRAALEQLVGELCRDVPVSP